MNANSYIIAHLCRGTVAYLEQSNLLVAGINSLTTQDDWRLADEEHFEIPGLFLPQPSVVVGCELVPIAEPAQGNPISLVAVSVTLRCTVDLISAQQHADLSTAVATPLWDEAALQASLNAYPDTVAPVLIVSGAVNTEARFLQQARLRETRFLVNVQASPRTT